MYKQIWQKIINSNKIVLISHINPDGDALGSSLGLYHILKNMGKNVSIVNMTKPAEYLNFLPSFDKIKQTLPTNFDLMVSMDCASFDRLGVEDKPQNLINIDHHISNTNYANMNLVEDISSTAQVVFNLLNANDVKIDKTSAVCLYTALVTDTGNFQYESVNSRVFNMASKLVECGVEVAFVSKMLYEREKLSRLRFLSKALDTLQLHLDAKVGIVVVDKEMLNHTGATKDDTDGLVNMVRKLSTVEVAIMLREEENADIKVSLRSKNYFNVSELAVKYGGGGHIRASGFSVNGKNFAYIIEMLIKDIREKI